MLLLVTCGNPLALAQVPETTGGDAVCASCHEDIARSYAETGMARSFAKAASVSKIEDFARGRGTHEASRRHYAFSLENGTYQFKRHQTDEAGNELNVFQQQVDWVLGSGARARNYLYQTGSGELYLLPIGYYSQEKMWFMAPGFDRATHEGVGKRVGRDCLFCHTDYPALSPREDEYGIAPTFPKELPQGIGCGRCHGAGEAHVAAATDDAGDITKIRSSIVNPSRLAPELRDDVCNQCHMQPSFAVDGVRRFGRGDFSYEVGEPLSDYLVQIDPVIQDQPRSERFEINHHSYRLEQSKCFQASVGLMSCTSCHDPHRTVSVAERAEHYRAACAKCHTSESYAAVHAAATPPVTGDNCVSCHMQERRTQDVVHASATDHLIRRTPADDGVLLAKLNESRPHVVEIELAEPDKLAPNEQNLYRAVAAVRSTSGADKGTVERLELLLTQVEPKHVEPYLDLVMGYLKQRRFADAETAVRKILTERPKHSQAQEWLGLSLLAQQRFDDAQKVYDDLLAEDPGRPEANFNYGLLLIGKDDYSAAVTRLEEAVTARHNMAPAWYYLGYAHGKLGRLNESFASYRKVLQIEPSHARAYVGIAQTLVAQGNTQEAIRYLEHGLKSASQIAGIAEELDRIRAGAN